VVLGTGAGVVYVEPRAAVGLNNDLSAAQAEAMAAEEAVLWRLTGLIIDRHVELAALLDSVVWLDVAAARHRCACSTRSTRSTRYVRPTPVLVDACLRPRSSSELHGPCRECARGSFFAHLCTSLHVFARLCTSLHTCST